MAKLIRYSLLFIRHCSKAAHLLFLTAAQRFTPYPRAPLEPSHLPTGAQRLTVPSLNLNFIFEHRSALKLSAPPQHSRVPKVLRG